MIGEQRNLEARDHGFICVVCRSDWGKTRISTRCQSTELLHLTGDRVFVWELTCKCSFRWLTVPSATDSTAVRRRHVQNVDLPKRVFVFQTCVLPSWTQDEYKDVACPYDGFTFATFCLFWEKQALQPRLVAVACCAVPIASHATPSSLCVLYRII